MLSMLAVAGLLAHVPLSAAAPPDPVAEFREWASANGYELLDPVCSAARVCYSAIPPGDVVIVWVGGEEGTLYMPEDGAQVGVSDDTFEVLTELDANLYFIGAGEQICLDYLAAKEFGASSGVGAEAMGEIVYGFLIWEFETNWSAQWGNEYRATDQARATFRDRLDACGSLGASESAAHVGWNETLLRAVETAQRVATSTADEDWDTYRQLRPEPSYTDAELETGYAGLESVFVALASRSEAEGGAIDLHLGLIAHESRPAGPQTALHCVVWRYFPDVGTILGLSGTANVEVVPGFVDPAELVGRAEIECADGTSTAGPSATPSTVPPELVVVPMDGLHVEMRGRYATVFDDCANVECTLAGGATEMGAVLPAGWQFTAGYVGEDGVLHVTATSGADTQTWAIISVFDPQQWQMGGQ